MSWYFQQPFAKLHLSLQEESAHLETRIALLFRPWTQMLAMAPSCNDHKKCIGVKWWEKTAGNSCWYKRSGVHVGGMKFQSERVFGKGTRWLKSEVEYTLTHVVQHLFCFCFWNMEVASTVLLHKASLEHAWRSGSGTGNGKRYPRSHEFSNFLPLCWTTWKVFMK